MKTESTNLGRKLKFGRWGLMENPKQLHCAFDYSGRTYLGNIEQAFYDHVTGTTRLKVRHFNGEPWPVDPPAANVRILD